MPIVIVILIQCFNPRAREGRDATTIEAAGIPPNVSIHAPAKGATIVIEYASFDDQSFNPRAREGRDFSWGAGFRHYICFNPRAREGRDARVEPGCGKRFTFQSTRPRRARPQITTLTKRIHCFNPRAREGRDFLTMR